MLWRLHGEVCDFHGSLNQYSAVLIGEKHHCDITLWSCAWVKNNAHRCYCCRVDCWLYSVVCAMWSQNGGPPSPCSGTRKMTAVHVSFVNIDKTLLAHGLAPREQDESPMTQPAVISMTSDAPRLVRLQQLVARWPQGASARYSLLQTHSSKKVLP